MAKEKIYEKIATVRRYIFAQPEAGLENQKLNEIEAEVHRLNYIGIALCIGICLAMAYSIILKIDGSNTCETSCARIYGAANAGYSYGILGECTCLTHNTTVSTPYKVLNPTTWTK